MDPYVSRLISPVTEYSATQGSSGFSDGHWPGMDTARLLLTLKQGLRSLEEYVQEYLDIAYFSDLPDSGVSAARPESQQHVTAARPESRPVSADRPESPQHVSTDLPEWGHVRADTPRSSRSVFHYRSLISSVRDSPLVSARTAGIPKPNHSSPPVPELIPLSETLLLMGIAFWCVWAAYTTTELPEVVSLTAVFPEVMVPAAVSPEVAVHAAEPPDAAVLTSAPRMVVASSNELPACCVAVKETITELSCVLCLPL
ncbi:uncharacterized protein LOC131536963 isoform X1 [Onychostoma macrolepis]|uniref:uncharacterized protein LOC131536963 isoform X1 n=1 Tax=Onychostoma macrolepis TaxID=369639 RepID=UPI00272CFA97|nr:uncharacterized protein LOC131536963 isoform X1 [Onychostoma macrolepis]